MSAEKIDVLYEEGAILVINKPSGLLCQAPPGIDSLELRVRDWLRQRDEKTGKFYLALTHRLDRPASGAVIFARNVRAARRINEQFKARTVKKIYWAIVEGKLANNSGQWHDHMRKIPNVAKAEIVDQDHCDGKDANLQYTVLATKDDLSLLEIELGTGRSHQSRLQASTRGHPILGDELYGAANSFGPLEPDPRKRPIALHARRLCFEHPILHQAVKLECPLPEQFGIFDFEKVGMKR